MTNIKNLLDKAILAVCSANDSELVDFRLEEFDSNQNNIVISYLVPDTNPIKGIGSALANRAYERVYKTIYFDENNEVASVKIYQQ